MQTWTGDAYDFHVQGQYALAVLGGWNVHVRQQAISSNDIVTSAVSYLLFQMPFVAY